MVSYAAPKRRLLGMKSRAAVSVYDIFAPRLLMFMPQLKMPSFFPNWRGR